MFKEKINNQNLVDELKIKDKNIENLNNIILAIQKDYEDQTKQTSNSYNSYNSIDFDSNYLGKLITFYLIIIRILILILK